METIDYQSYTVEELRLIAPYDPEAEAELRRREEASPDAAPPKATVPETESAAPPEPGDAAAAYAETMERLQAVQQHELNRRWREEEDPYAGLAYAARLLRDSDSVSERTAAMDMLRKLEIVFMEQLGEQKGVPRLALRDVQLFLAAGYRSGVRATGESDAPAELAFRRYENAYELDSGCVGTLAWCWQTGYGTRKDPKRAAQLLEAAHDGSAASWKRLGDAYALLGWNAKAEECYAAVQSLERSEAHRKKHVRVRSIARVITALALVGGISLVLLLGRWILRDTSKEKYKASDTAAPAETPAPAAQFATEDVLYYGVVEHVNGRKYYARLNLEEAADGVVPAYLTLYQLDKTTRYESLEGYLMTRDDENAMLALQSDSESYAFEVHYVGTIPLPDGCELFLDGDNSLIRDVELFTHKDADNVMFFGEKYDKAVFEIELTRSAQLQSASETLEISEGDNGLLSREYVVNCMYIRDAEPAVSEAEATYTLNGAYTKFHFDTIPFEDRTGRSFGTYAVFLDGRQVTEASDEIKFDDEFEKGFSIDVTGVQELKLVIYSENGGANGNGDLALANLFVFK